MPVPCARRYAFCEHSEADFEEVRRFRKMTCCLFSLLHAVALDEIRGPEYQEMELHIVHWDLLDRRSRETLRQSPNRVQLSMQWLERCARGWPGWDLDGVLEDVLGSLQEVSKYSDRVQDAFGILR